MIAKLLWSVKHPIWSVANQVRRIRQGLGPKKGVLLYLGMNKGESFEQIFRSYEQVFGFEPIPELHRELDDRYRKFKNVRIINAAIGEQAGHAQFNISDNRALSSSLGSFNSDWPNAAEGNVRFVKSITVPVINLAEFCAENSIDYIDEYISDIQGMDLAALKTMSSFIDRGKIGAITCEVTKDGKSIYEDLPDNCLGGFKDLLSERYDLVATGSGLLKDGQLDTVPDSWWEMDCKWRVRQPGAEA